MRFFKLVFIRYSFQLVLTQKVIALEKFRLGKGR